MKLPLSSSSSSSKPAFLLDDQEFDLQDVPSEDTSIDPENQPGTTSMSATSSSFFTAKKPFPTDFGTQASSGFFGLNLDIIWAGIAFGCLLGVAMFWFQGAQPTLLRGYTKSTLNQLTTLEGRNTGQVNALIQSYNTMSERSLYNAFTLCAEDQLYQTQSDDIAFLENQQRALLPASNVSSVEPYNGFYIQSFVDQYKSVFELYSSKNQEYADYITDAKTLPFYLQYRNIWIQSCVDIRDSQGDVGAVQAACTTLQTATDEYTQNESVVKPQLWAEALPIISQGIQKCQQYSAGQNFGRWQLDWLSSYDVLMTVQPDFTQRSEQLAADGEEFSAQADAARQAIEKEFNQKENGGSVYFMNISL